MLKKLNRVGQKPAWSFPVATKVWREKPNNILELLGHGKGSVICVHFKEAKLSY